MGEKQGKKRNIWLWVLLGALGITITVALLLQLCREERGTPTLMIETPRKLSASQTEAFCLDVGLSDLGEAIYPAMSMCITFDPSRLEFLGIEEGNVFIMSSESQTGQQLPQWNCNVQVSNETGRINLMYLDMTGGKNAFSRSLLGKENNVLLGLKFRLRGSVRPGEVLDLIVEDAVFAASEEAQSLAMTTGTLRTRNSRLVIGE